MKKLIWRNEGCLKEFPLSRIKPSLPLSSSNNMHTSTQVLHRIELHTEVVIAVILSCKNFS